MGLTLGQICYLLKDELSNETISNISYALDTRIFKPMNLSFNNDTWMNNKNFWETYDNNCCFDCFIRSNSKRFVRNKGFH